MIFSARILLCWILLACGVMTVWAADDESRRKQAQAMFEASKAEDFAQVADIHAEEVLKLQQHGVRVLLVDTRAPAERAVSILPGAVTEAQFEADPELRRGAIVVAYCTIGYRSGMLAKKMAGQGVSVLNLYAGMLDWVHAGGTLVDAQGHPTNKLHVYGERWDLGPAGIEGVY
ncbi:rhodanese-like domain-containing protein [Megalodesulfovibrio paquesii]